MITELKDGQPTFHAPDQAAWRQWLMENHVTHEVVWLIGYRKASGMVSVSHSEAVDEALCFGWIDSKRVKRDAQSFYQCFGRRKPRGTWSKINKAKIEAQIAAGKMMPAGLHVIELAKANGSWATLDDVEAQKIPEDLAAAFAQNPIAEAHFLAFPPSARKAILHWIIQAKGADTRARRVAEAVAKASLGERANAAPKRASEPQ
jgi:uncharacterized protein YdeI (YjbR/CyaY-like superfamily)